MCDPTVCGDIDEMDDIISKLAPGMNELHGHPSRVRDSRKKFRKSLNCGTYDEDIYLGVI